MHMHVYIYICLYHFFPTVKPATPTLLFQLEIVQAYLWFNVSRATRFSTFLLSPNPLPKLQRLDQGYRVNQPFIYEMVE